MFILFQPLYLEELGADPFLIGIIMGAIGVVMAIGHLPAGFLSDRFGRRPLLIAAWIIGLAATWLMALADSLQIFVIGGALYGLTAFVIAPLNSYVTAANRRLSTGRVLTLTSAAYNAGAFLGPMLGGLIGEQFGLRRNFLIAAVIFTFSTLIILNIRPQPVVLPHTQEWWRQPKRVLQPRFIQYLGVVFVVMFCLYLPQPLSQNFLLNERDLNLTSIGFLISARSLGVVILNLILGWVQAPLGFLLSQISVGLFTLLIGFGTGLPSYFLGYFLMGGYQTARALASAQTRDLIDKTNMGLAYGSVETVNSIAIIIAPPLAGILYNQNPEWIYMLSFVLIGVAIMVTLIFSPVKIKLRAQN